MSEMVRLKCPKCKHKWWELIGGWGLFPDGMIKCPKCKKRIEPIWLEKDLRW